MIKYTERAVRGLSYLFRPFNDIDVYVEDTTCLGLYEMLLGRMLNGKAKVSRVFQLGGRARVIEACKSDQAARRRRRLYIIDGDFDAIEGHNAAPKLKHIYQLKTYCSENLVVSDNAVHEVARGTLTNSAAAELATKVNLPLYYSQLMKLGDLLAIYIVARRLDPTLKTSGYNVARFTRRSGKSVTLDEDKIAARVAEIKQNLENGHSKRIVEAELKRAQHLVSARQDAVLRLLSGKTYILPFLHDFLRYRADYQGSRDQLAVQLSRFCELDIDPDFTRAVTSASKSAA